MSMEIVNQGISDDENFKQRVKRASPSTVRKRRGFWFCAARISSYC